MFSLLNFLSPYSARLCAPCGKIARLLRTNSSQTTIEGSVSNFKLRLEAREHPNNFVERSLTEVTSRTGCAPSLALRKRFKEIRKWPIERDVRMEKFDCMWLSGLLSSLIPIHIPSTNNRRGPLGTITGYTKQHTNCGEKDD